MCKPDPCRFGLNDRQTLEAASSRLERQQTKKSLAMLNRTKWLLSLCAPVQTALFTGSGLGRSPRLISLTIAPELPLQKWR